MREVRAQRRLHLSPRRGVMPFQEEAVQLPAANRRQASDPLRGSFQLSSLVDTVQCVDEGVLNILAPTAPAPLQRFHLDRMACDILPAAPLDLREVALQGLRQLAEPMGSAPVSDALLAHAEALVDEGLGHVARHPAQVKAPIHPGPDASRLRVPRCKSSREGGLQVVVAEVCVLLETASQELLHLFAVGEARPCGVVAAGAPEGRQLRSLRLSHLLERDAAPSPPPCAQRLRELVLLVPAVQRAVCRRPLHQLAADCPQATYWPLTSAVSEPCVDVKAAGHRPHLSDPVHIDEVRTPKTHDAVLWRRGCVLAATPAALGLATTLGGLAQGRLLVQ